MRCPLKQCPRCHAHYWRKNEKFGDPVPEGEDPHPKELPNHPCEGITFSKDPPLWICSECGYVFNADGKKETFNTLPLTKAADLEF